MSRPALSIPNCYCGDDETTFDLNCSCKRCNSRPSIIIHDIDKSFSKQQIELILQKLELGKIKQIDIDDKHTCQHVSIYVEYWTGDWRLRKSLRNGKNAKISFLDEYDETCEWELMAVKNEPKYINPTWKEDVRPVLQLQADYIDLDEPGSCTPRKDRKTKEDIRKEKVNRKKYYYLKNLYQSYDLTKYEKMIEKYGEGYVWRLDNAKSIESITQAFCKRHNLSKVNLQTNWIPQLHKDWYFDPNNKGKKIITFHSLSPMDRPIKDRVYEPLRKKMMLTIIGNWSSIGDRPYWLCQNLVNIIDDREDYTKEALKKIPKKYSYIKCCGGYKIYRNNFFIHPRIDIYIVDYNNKQGCYGLCHPIKNNKCTFYQQNQSPSACYPLDYILPLKQLQFEDIKVPVPNKYLKIIEKRYSKKWREYKQSKLQTFQHSFSFFIPILPYIEKMYGKSFFNAFQNIDKEWN